jgi:hypothetical protein
LFAFSRQQENQLSDLKSQLDEAIAAKLKVDKQKRDLEGRVDEMDQHIADSASKVCILSPL